MDLATRKPRHRAEWSGVVSLGRSRLEWGCSTSMNEWISRWIKRDQLDVTCFIISLFNAQHVSDVNTSIIRNLQLICWVISWVVLLWFDMCWCYVVVSVVVWYPYAGWGTSASTYEITQQISRKLLRKEVLTSETRWALNIEIIKQLTSSSSLFVQLWRWCTVQ